MTVPAETPLIAGPQRQSLWRFAPPAIFGVAVIAAWELATIVFDADPRLFPSPTEIIAAVGKDPGALLRNSWTTTVEMLIGFTAGAAIGIALGIALAYSKILRSAIYPWLIVSQTIPIPAVAAVLVIWFGFSILPKVIVVILISFFPIAVSTADGLDAVDPDMVRLMRTFGASKARIFREVRIPVALPFIFTGAKVAAAFSVLGAVFGEWVGARGGLGYLLLLKNRAINTDEVFAIIWALATLGIAFFGLVVLLERLAVPWYYTTRKEESR